MMKKHRNAVRIAVMMVLVLLMAVIAAPGMADIPPTTKTPNRTTLPGATSTVNVRPSENNHENTPTPKPTGKPTSTPGTPTPAPGTPEPVKTVTPKPTTSKRTPGPTPSPTPTAKPRHVLVPRITEINNDSKYVFLDQEDCEATFHVTGDPDMMITVEIIMDEGKQEDTAPINAAAPNYEIIFKYSQLSKAEKIVVKYFDDDKNPDFTTTYAVYRDSLDQYPTEPYLLLKEPHYTVMADGKEITGNEIDADLKELSVKAPENLDIELQIIGKSMVPSHSDPADPELYVFDLEGKLKGDDVIVLLLKDSFGNPIKEPPLYRVKHTPIAPEILESSLGKKYAFLDQQGGVAHFYLSGEYWEGFEIKCISRYGGEFTRKVPDVPKGESTENKVNSIADIDYFVLSNSDQIEISYPNYHEQKTTYAIYHSEENAQEDKGEKPYLLLLPADFKVMIDGNDKTDADGIDADSWKLRVETEADLTVLLSSNDWKNIPIALNTDFKLNGNDFELHAGDEIILTLTDSYGNSKEKRYPVKAADPKKVDADLAGDPSAKVIKIDGNIYVDNSGYSGIEKITLTVQAGPFRTIVLNGLSSQKYTGRTNAEGKCDLNPSVKGLEEGEYDITIFEEGVTDPDKQWRTKLIIDRSIGEIKVVEVREGAKTISVKCEPDVTFFLIVDGKQEVKVNAKEDGSAELTPTTLVRSGVEIVVKAVDILGHERNTEVTIKGVVIESLKPEDQSEPLYISEGHKEQKVLISGTGLDGAVVNLWLSNEKDSTTGGEKVGSVELKDGSAEFIVNEKMVREAKVNEVFYLIAKYDQFDGAASLEMTYDPGCALKLDEDTMVTTATKELKGKADPGATVTVYVNGKEWGSAKVGEDGDGSFTLTLTERLKTDDEVVIEAVDQAGNVKKLDAIKAKRKGVRSFLLFLLVAGLILLGFSVMGFVTTRKKLRAIEDISRSTDEETVRIDRKKR